MRNLVLSICAICLNEPVFAGSATLFDCKMTSECINEGGCAETDVDLAVERSAGSAHPFSLITPAETIEGVFLDDNNPDAATYLLARATGAYHLLSVTVDGKAYWSAHLPGAEMVITYLGTCEAGS